MKILVVENDVTSAMLIESRLGKQGHEVVLEFDGQKATNRLLEGDVDVVVFEADVKRFELAEAMKTLAEGGRKIPKLIVATELDREDYNQSSHPATMEAFFEKPYSADTLVDTISRLGHTGQVQASRATERGRH